MDMLDFLRKLQGSRCQGDGVRREIDLDIRNAYLKSDGSALTTTLTTNPGFVALETNGMGIQWAATKVVGAAFDFPIPRDYDQTRDELRVRVYAYMGGATDTPGLTLNVYRKRLATALTANLGPVTGKTESSGVAPLTSGQAAAVALSANLKVVEFEISGNSFQGGDVLFFELVPAAHGTDAVNLVGGVVMYKSDIVFWSESAR